MYIFHVHFPYKLKHISTNFPLTFTIPYFLLNSDDELRLPMIMNEKKLNV